MTQPLAIAVTVLGTLIVMFAIIDMGQTVISVAGRRGWLTHKLSHTAWTVLLRVRRRLDRPRLLAAGGPLILAGVIGTWLLMLVIGWGMVFGATGSVVEAGTAETASPSARFYYASALMLGRGTPRFEPATPAWQSVEQLAALSGLVLLSLAIAYVLPVVSAVVNQRRTAAYISTLGYTVEEVLGRAWNGSDLGHLHLHLIDLGRQINELAEQHYAYPVLHYFHSRERHSAIGPAIALIDETLIMLDCLEENVRVHPTTSGPLRAAIDDYLDTLMPAYVVAGDAPLGRPPIDRLRDIGVPLDEDDDVDAIYAQAAQRRRQLRAVVEHHGWDGDEVLQSPRWAG